MYTVCEYIKSSTICIQCMTYTRIMKYLKYYTYIYVYCIFIDPQHLEGYN